MKREHFAIELNILIESGMKHVLRSRVDEGEGDKQSGKDWSIGLVKVVSILVIFVAGIVIGLSVSAHGTRYVSSRTELFFPSIDYLPTCENKDCLSIRSFIYPGRLNHEMTDEEIFWRASMVPKKEEYPYKRVPKVAFMFLTRGPLPLAPLWDRFFHGHEELYSVYVHALPGYKLNVSEASAFYGRQIPSQV